MVGILKEPEATGLSHKIPAKSKSAKESEVFQKEPQGKGFPITRDSRNVISVIEGSLSTGTRITLPPVIIKCRKCWKGGETIERLTVCPTAEGEMGRPWHCGRAWVTDDMGNADTKRPFCFRDKIIGCLQ